MVALGVELLAGQVGQAVDVVEIIEAVSRLLEGEAVGVIGFQPILVVLGEGDQAQGLALLPGVLGDGIQGRLGVPFAHGPEIRVAQGAGQAGEQAVALAGVPEVVGVLPAEEDGEAVIAQGQSLCVEQGLDPGGIGCFGELKWCHRRVI